MRTGAQTRRGEGAREGGGSCAVGEFSRRPPLALAAVVSPPAGPGPACRTYTTWLVRIRVEKCVAEGETSEGAGRAGATCVLFNYSA